MANTGGSPCWREARAILTNEPAFWSDRRALPSVVVSMRGQQVNYLEQLQATEQRQNLLPVSTLLFPC